MLLILEIAMFGGGLYALIAGKLPTFLFSHRVEGLNARLIGLLLIIPLPLAFFAGLVLGLLFGEQGTGYAAIVEIVFVFGVALLTVILSRIVGKRDETISDIESVIKKKSQGALFYALTTILGFAAIITCPLAIIYATQAIKLINTHGIGEEHRSKAKTARMIAIIGTSAWGVIILSFVLFYNLFH